MSVRGRCCVRSIVELVVEGDSLDMSVSLCCLVNLLCKYLPCETCDHRRFGDIGNFDLPSQTRQNISRKGERQKAMVLQRRRET
jgi:hypothetical protein